MKSMLKYLSTDVDCDTVTITNYYYQRLLK